MSGNGGLITIHAGTSSYYDNYLTPEEKNILKDYLVKYPDIYKQSYNVYYTKNIDLLLEEDLNLDKNGFYIKINSKFLYLNHSFYEFLSPQNVKDLAEICLKNLNIKDILE